MSESFADSLAATALTGTNADFIEILYQRYQSDPKSVDPGWARYFAGLKSNGVLAAPASRSRAVQSAPSTRAAPAAEAARPVAADTGAASAKQAAVSRLIQVFANRGHLIANLDPLGLLRSSAAQRSRSCCPCPR